MRLLPLILATLVLAGCRREPVLPVPGTPIDADAAVRVLGLDPVSADVSNASGFFASADLVVTCRHAVAGRTLPGVVKSDGRRLAAAVVAEDEGSDLAVLRTEEPGPARLELADRMPGPGDRVRALTKDGTFPGYAVEPMRDEDGRPLVGFTAAGVGPGSAGGALVDDRGKAVGVILPARAEDPSRWPAVPPDRARRLLNRARR